MSRLRELRIWRERKETCFKLKISLAIPQARNRIGFHCFTEIGQIRHNRYIINNNKKDLQGFIRGE